MKKFIRPFALFMMAITLCFSFTFSAVTLSTKSYAQESSVSAPSASSTVAVDPAVDSLPKVTNEDLFKSLLDSMGGIKGAKTLGIVFIICKLLLLLILSPFFTNMFPKLENGGTKLLIAVGLNLVVGVLGLMVTNGLSFGMALVHSSTLALASVFVNQAYKQFFVKAKA